MPENVDGYVDFTNKEVYINPNAKNAQDIVIKHELTHILERSRGSRYVRSAMGAIKRKMPKVWEEAYQKNWEKYEKLSESNPDLAPTRARIESETLADFSVYFAKDDVIRHYAMNSENRSFIQTMKDFFGYILLQSKAMLGKDKAVFYEAVVAKWDMSLRKAVENSNVHDSGNGVRYGVMYSAPNDKKSLSIKAQLKTHMKEIMLRPVVKRISFDMKDGKTMSEVRSEIYKTFLERNNGEKELTVSREGFGEVKVGYDELKKGVKYFHTKEEVATVEAIPNVIREGMQINVNDNHKDRGHPTFTFAAPVELNGQLYAMAVVVKRTGDNKYKVHRLLMPDGAVLEFSEKETAEATINRMTVENDGESRSITSAVDTSISQDNPGVNSYSMQEAENDAADVSFSVSDSGAGTSSGQTVSDIVSELEEVDRMIDDESLSDEAYRELDRKSRSLERKLAIASATRSADDSGSVSQDPIQPAKRSSYHIDKMREAVNTYREDGDPSGIPARRSVDASRKRNQHKLDSIDEEIAEITDEWFREELHPDERKAMLDRVEQLKIDKRNALEANRVLS